MTYDPEEMLLLLLSVRHSDSSLFVSRHLTSGTSGALCAQALKDGYLFENRRKLELTERGRSFIRETNRRLGRKGIDSAIASVPNEQIDPIGIDDIYLPEKM